MKKFFKVCMILALVFVLIGLCAIGISAAFGASWGTFYSALRQGDFSINLYNYSDDYTDNDEYEAEDTEDSSDALYTFSEIQVPDELKVDINRGSIQIMETSKDEVYIEVTKGDKNNVRVGRDDGTLTIESKSRLRQSTEILLYLPEDTTLSKADIEIGGGEARIDTLNVGELDVEVGAGSLQADGVITADESDWSVGAGEIILAHLDSTDSRFECGVGSIEVEMAGKKSDYSWSVKSGIGSVTLGDSVIGGIGGEASDHDSSLSRKIEAECGIGEIEISFLEQEDSHE
ncbi:MAG: DUF4097 family beta strand repeat-containing protein [Lachnospiraceae bacterium]